MVGLYIKLCQFLETSCFADCCYIIVQAGLGFDVDTSTALYSTVAAKVAAKVITKITAETTTEITVEIAAEVLTEVVTEILVVQLNQGVGNLVYHYIIVQAQ